VAGRRRGAASTAPGARASWPDSSRRNGIGLAGGPGGARITAGPRQARRCCDDHNDSCRSRHCRTRPHRRVVVALRGRREAPVLVPSLWRTRWRGGGRLTGAEQPFQRGARGAHTAEVGAALVLANRPAALHAGTSAWVAVAGEVRLTPGTHRVPARACELAARTVPRAPAPVSNQVRQVRSISVTWLRAPLPAVVQAHRARRRRQCAGHVLSCARE
jgi:hypothetical protein